MGRQTEIGSLTPDEEEKLRNRAEEDRGFQLLVAGYETPAVSALLASPHFGGFARAQERYFKACLDNRDTPGMRTEWQAQLREARKDVASSTGSNARAEDIRAALIVADWRQINKLPHS